MRTFAGNEQDLFFLSVLAHTSRLLFEGELDLLLLATPLLQKIICICKQRPEAGGEIKQEALAWISPGYTGPLRLSHQTS